MEDRIDERVRKDRESERDGDRKTVWLGTVRLWYENGKYAKGEIVVLV